MDTSNPTFQEFQAYWQLSEDLVALATKDDIAEVARILAMQLAHYTRTFGELPIPDMSHLLATAGDDENSVTLLRDGTRAFVAVMGVVSEDAEVSDSSLHLISKPTQSGVDPNVWCRPATCAPVSFSNAC